MPFPLGVLLGREVFGLFGWQWLGTLIALVAGQLFGRVVASVLTRVARRLASRTEGLWDDVFVEAASTPVRVLCIVIATYVPLRGLRLPVPLASDLSSLVHATCIGVAGWAMIRALHATAYAIGDVTATRETNDPGRLNRARSMRTRLILANRLGSLVIFLVVGALVVLQFQAVRSVGVSLLASAGLAGVVLGFAAQKSLGTLFAGIQLSISQPIRMGDSVTLDGEFGTIEDVGLTFVTVKLWDERRLLVPTTRLLDQSLQNWSRTTVGLVGSVLLKVAFEIPVDAARSQFDSIIAEEPLWDGRIRSVQVTDAGERSIEIRFLMSARTPGALWDLRTSVREKLVVWLQHFEHGAHLPHTRVVMADGEGNEAAAGTADLS